MLWLMNEPILVIIVGAPVACNDGVKDSWREVAKWTALQLRSRFGDQVQVQYFDLFDPECPMIPADSQLPLVLVNGTLVSTGGKISIPLIRKKIDELVLS
jgi:hypothetical protein